VENNRSPISHSANKEALHEYGVEDPARAMDSDCPTHDLIYTLRPVMTLPHDQRPKKGRNTIEKIMNGDGNIFRVYIPLSDQPVEESLCIHRTSD
jgi:hypothetical protein